MTNGDINIQKMLQNALKDKMLLIDPIKKVKEYKPMDRRKPPQIKQKAWREKEALETFKQESPGFKKCKLTQHDTSG